MGSRMKRKVRGGPSPSLIESRMSGTKTVCNGGYRHSAGFRDVLSSASTGCSKVSMPFLLAFVLFLAGPGGVDLGSDAQEDGGDHLSYLYCENGCSSWTDVSCEKGVLQGSLDVGSFLSMGFENYNTTANTYCLTLFAVESIPDTHEQFFGINVTIGNYSGIQDEVCSTEQIDINAYTIAENVTSFYVLAKETNNEDGTVTHIALGAILEDVYTPELAPVLEFYDYSCEHDFIRGPVTIQVEEDVVDRVEVYLGSGPESPLMQHQAGENETLGLLFEWTPTADGLGPCSEVLGNCLFLSRTLNPNVSHVVARPSYKTCYGGWVNTTITDVSTPTSHGLTSITFEDDDCTSGFSGNVVLERNLTGQAETSTNLHVIVRACSDQSCACSVDEWGLCSDGNDPFRIKETAIDNTASRINFTVSSDTYLSTMKVALSAMAGHPNDPQYCINEVDTVATTFANERFPTVLPVSTLTTFVDVDCAKNVYHGFFIFEEGNFGTSSIVLHADTYTLKTYNETGSSVYSTVGVLPRATFLNYTIDHLELPTTVDHFIISSTRGKCEGSQFKKHTIEDAFAPSTTISSVTQWTDEDRSRGYITGSMYLLNAPKPEEITTFDVYFGDENSQPIQYISTLDINEIANYNYVVSLVSVLYPGPYILVYSRRKSAEEVWCENPQPFVFQFTDSISNFPKTHASAIRYSGDYACAPDKIHGLVEVGRSAQEVDIDLYKIFFATGEKICINNLNTASSCIVNGELQGQIASLPIRAPVDMSLGVVSMVNGELVVTFSPLGTLFLAVLRVSTCSAALEDTTECSVVEADVLNPSTSSSARVKGLIKSGVCGVQLIAEGIYGEATSEEVVVLADPGFLADKLPPINVTLDGDWKLSSCTGSCLGVSKGFARSAIRANSSIASSLVHQPFIPWTGNYTLRIYVPQGEPEMFWNATLSYSSQKFLYSSMMGDGVLPLTSGCSGETSNCTLPSYYDLGVHELLKEQEVTIAVSNAACRENVTFVCSSTHHNITDENGTVLNTTTDVACHEQYSSTCAIIVDAVVFGSADMHIPTPPSLTDYPYTVSPEAVTFNILALAEETLSMRVQVSTSSSFASNTSSYNVDDLGANSMHEVRIGGLAQDTVYFFRLAMRNLTFATLVENFGPTSVGIRTGSNVTASDGVGDGGNAEAELLLVSIVEAEAMVATLNHVENTVSPADLISYRISAHQTSDAGTSASATSTVSTACIIPEQLSLGNQHMCVRFSDGAVNCWGTYRFISNTTLGTVAGAVIEDVPANGQVLASEIDAYRYTNYDTMIVSGEDHSCLLDDGYVRCWGSNMHGEAYAGGNKTEVDPWGADEPEKIHVAVSRIVQISAGGRHTCAVNSMGKVRCWGWGAHGQLGNGTTTDIGTGQLTLVDSRDIDLPEDAIQVVAGYAHTCVLSVTGKVYCWGLGSSGQLGLASTESVGDDEPPAETPVQVAKVDFLVAGSEHTCAKIATSEEVGNEIICWGSNLEGQLGQNVATTDGSRDYVGDDEHPIDAFGGNYLTLAAPVGVITPVPTVTHMCAGSHHTCIVLDNIHVKCWGRNSDGQLGFAGPEIVDNVTDARFVDGLYLETIYTNLTYGSGLQAIRPDALDRQTAHVSDLRCGVNRTCVLLNTGAIRCFGAIDESVSTAVPTAVAGLNETLTCPTTVKLGGLTPGTTYTLAYEYTNTTGHVVEHMASQNAVNVTTAVIHQLYDLPEPMVSNVGPDVMNVMFESVQTGISSLIVEYMNVSSASRGPLEEGSAIQNVPWQGLVNFVADGQVNITDYPESATGATLRLTGISDPVGNTFVTRIRATNAFGSWSSKTSRPITTTSQSTAVISNVDINLPSMSTNIQAYSTIILRSGQEKSRTGTVGLPSVQFDDVYNPPRAQRHAQFCFAGASSTILVAERLDSGPAGHFQPFGEVAPILPIGVNFGYVSEDGHMRDVYPDFVDYINLQESSTYQNHSIVEGYFTKTFDETAYPEVFADVTSRVFYVLMYTLDDYCSAQEPMAIRIDSVNQVPAFAVSNLRSIYPHGSNHLDISWDVVGDQDSYVVEVKEAGSSDEEYKLVDVFIQDQLTIVPNLETWVEYTVRVRASWHNCTASTGSTVNAIPSIVPQFAPENVVISEVTTGSLVLSWNPVLNATKYNVYIRNAASSEADFAPIALDYVFTTINVTNLQYAELYYLRVEPGNIAGYNPSVVTDVFEATQPRKALMDFYFAVGGDEWTQNTNWGVQSPENICIWDGIVCDEIDPPEPEVTCQCVALRKILLRQNNLQGTLPVQIEHLDTVTVLNMQDNSVSGTIPSEIGLMSSLEILNLAQNELIDLPPIQLDQLVNLEQLVMYENDLVGSIPVSWGNLEKLETFDIHNNGFFFTLERLAENNVFEKWNRMRTFDISDNQLSGPIPYQMKNMTLLEVFKFSNNDFYGDLPPDFDNSIADGGFQHLTDFACERNFIDMNFDCDCSTEYGCVNHAAAIDGSGVCPLAEASGWSFNCGPLKGQIQIENLAVFYANSGGNSWTEGSASWFNGALPDLLCDTSQAYEMDVMMGIDCSFGVIVSLELPRNNLVGLLSAEVGDITSLKRVILNGNHISGTIPVSWGQLASLEELDISGNQISGTIPFNVKYLFSVVQYDIHDNRISGTLPEYLAEHNLEDLLVQENQLRGTIPTEYAVRMRSLSRMDFSHNILEGTIPSELTILTNLNELNVQSNNITGCIPSDFDVNVLESITCSDTYIFQAVPNTYQELLGGAKDCSPIRQYCGDGKRTPFEECDDGNAVSGEQDGCNPDCTIFAGWYCDDQDHPYGGTWSDWNLLRVTGVDEGCDFLEYDRGTSMCAEQCGDGILTLSEECDDGNAVSDMNGFDDGCSSTCAIMIGWTCERPDNTVSICSENCGDGIRTYGPAEGQPLGCDAGDLNSLLYGCYNCIEQPGFECDENSQGLSTCSEVCGDGVLTNGIYGSEFCDDGNNADGDGCTSTCTIEYGWTCTEVSLETSICNEVCGNGIVTTSEQCDSQSGLLGAGCDSHCFELPGYNCHVDNVSQVSSCSPVCGAWQPNPGWAKYYAGTYVSPDEQCDDGNSNSLDGCDGCQIKLGWYCDNEAVLDRYGSIVDFGITQTISCDPVCGDGIVVWSAGEECDPGTSPGAIVPMAPGELRGCNPLTCKIIRGWNCEYQPPGASDPVECNDANLLAPDGIPQSSFTLSQECGNGIVTEDEECDQLGVNIGATGQGLDDGCSQECTIQTGWQCTYPNPNPRNRAIGSHCVEVCGNGYKTNGPEEHDALACDDGNRVSGDGCSRDCRIEFMWTCENFPADHPEQTASICTYVSPVRVLGEFFYQGLGGQGWYNRYKWDSVQGHEDDEDYLSYINICQFYGVTCRVNDPIKIELRANNLVGTIPERLTFLGSLEEISLPLNGIYGTLPESFAMLSNLNILDLSSNRIVAFNITLAASVTALYFGRNLLTGTIPPMNYLTNLETLDLNNNALSGPIGDLCGRDDDGVSQTGPDHCAPLESIDISHNQITNIDALTQVGGTLQEVSAHHNAIVGYISSSFTGQNMMSALERLDLSYNSLSTDPMQSSKKGVSEGKEGSSSPVMKTIYQKNTQMEDGFADIGLGMPQLELLNLEHNDLGGPIPTSIGLLTRLWSLKLGNNQLTGTIPPLALQNLQGIIELDLASNLLSGTVPQELSHLTRLTSLTIHENNITGVIPGTFASMSQLRTVSCGETFIINRVPGNIDTCVGDYRIYAASNLCDRCAPYRDCKAVEDCNLNGACFAENNGGTQLSISCRCLPGYMGPRCEACAIGYVEDTSTSTSNTKCVECPGGADNVCNGRGRSGDVRQDCLFNVEDRTSYCDCEDGWEGTACEDAEVVFVSLRESSGARFDPLVAIFFSIAASLGVLHF